MTAALVAVAGHYVPSTVTADGLHCVGATQRPIGIDFVLRLGSFPAPATVTGEDPIAHILRGAVESCVSAHCTRLRAADRITGCDATTLTIAGTPPTQLFYSDALSSRIDVGQHLALWARREMLARLGFAVESHLLDLAADEARESFWIFLKREPFRDVAQIQVRTPIELVGYYRGCAIILADGEEVYYPLETLTMIDSEIKDEHYYQTMDANRNGVPDPLEYLPSKVALGTSPGRDASPDQNWQPKPDLKQVAGHFNAIPLERNGSVVERYGVLQHHYDEVWADKRGRIAWKAR